MNRDRGWDGRFRGRARFNVEDVPRLPTFPARWVLSDPRRRPYFVFWTRDGRFFWSLFMERLGQGEAVRVWPWGGGSYTVPIIIGQPLPRGGGTAILYRCPECRQPRQYLYPLRVVRGVAVDYFGPWCQACLGLRWASQGWYISALARALFHRPGRQRDPRHREPWDPRAVSDPRMVMDEFPELAFVATSPVNNREDTGRQLLSAAGAPVTGAGETPKDDGLEVYVPVPQVTEW